MIFISNISLRSCDSYKYNVVYSALKKTIDDLGGIDKFVKPGEKVMLKVNLLLKKAPSAAATTHPSIVCAMASLLIEHGARVVIADSPGGPFNETGLKIIYSACEMTKAAERSGASLNYNTAAREISNSEGLLLKRLSVIDALFEVDKLINMCKLKTHGMTTMTCAVKNMFGIIPGVTKAQYHLSRPNPEDFANALIDICLYAKPTLTVVDAIVGMEGQGPSGGKPKKIGAILASENPFELDVLCAHLIKLSPESVITIKESIKRGLCPSSVNGLDIICEKPLSEYVVKSFDVPKSRSFGFLSEKIPKPIRRVIDKNCNPRPEFIHSKCTGCTDCAKNCPPEAITMREHRPELELDKCIRCFCCQELCPHLAVTIKRPLLSRLMAKI